MVPPVHPARLTEVSRALADLRDGLADAEDALLSTLVVMGEPEPQRAVDGWVDQVVDLLRAVDEVAEQHVTTLERSVARSPASPREAATTTNTRSGAATPVDADASPGRGLW